MEKLFIEDLDVRGKRVIVRTDYNVPVKGGKVEDDKRIAASLPTVNYLLEKGAACESGKERNFRLIRVALKKATRDGDKILFLIANLPKTRVHAKVASVLYRKRWKIETAFQELTEHLRCEINTLGYPPAALFAFCVALVAYMILAAIKAALSSVYGPDRVDKEVSGYYIASELSAIYPGMMIAVSDDKWLFFRQSSQAELVVFLRQLAKNVNLSRFKKHTRGPKSF
jgi:hypothetical protein